MATRYAHDEIYALRDGRLSRRAAVSASSTKWKSVASAAGAVLSLGVVGSALRSPLPATLDLAASNLRGAEVEPLALPPGVEVTQDVLSEQANGRPVIVGELGPVSLPPSHDQEIKRPFEEAPRPWEILSDPQPGPPPGMDNFAELVPETNEETRPMLSENEAVAANQQSQGSGQSDLKDMLLQAFGIDGSTAKEDEAVTTAAEQNPSPVEQAEVAEAKHELREALLSQLGPQFDKQQDASKATGGSVPSVVAHDDATRWNWLHPPEETYPQLKREQGDLVSVDVVYQHLQEERDARKQKLQEEMQETEEEYQRTLDCFHQGVTQGKMVLSRDEYSRLVEWMNEKCQSEGDSGETSKQDGNALKNAYMTKAEFKTEITQRFHTVLEAFKQGQLSAKQAITQAQSVEDKIASCIDRATERAADSGDSGEGRIHKSKLDVALGWIINHCVDLP